MSSRFRKQSGILTAISRVMIAVFIAVFMAGGIAGCQAMEGVNVGASIPIGGVGSIGANKRIGDSQPSGQTQKKQDEDAEEED